MPVHKHKLAEPLGRSEKAEHVLVSAPLSKRDLTILHKYRDLQVLSLRGIQSDSLDFVADWADLRVLRLYGCKIGDWTPLTKCKRLEHLFINTIRDRTPNLSVLSQLVQLECVGVGYVPHLTTLPDMSRCTRLKRLRLFNCKRLEDLSPVLRIPNLESFHIVETPQGPTELEAIMAMPKMKYMTGAFGTKEKDALFRKLMAKYGLKYGE